MGNIYFDEDELLSFKHAEIRNAEIAEIVLYYWSNVRINEFVMSDSDLLEIARCDRVQDSM